VVERSERYASVAKPEEPRDSKRRAWAALVRRSCADLNGLLLSTNVWLLKPVRFKARRNLRSHVYRVYASSIKIPASSTAFSSTVIDTDYSYPVIFAGIFNLSETR
jgi:hypothetical protein